MNSSPIKTRVGGVSSPFKEETGPKQSWLASATEKIRKNLAENLNPYGYRDAFGRIYKAGIKGEQHPKRTRMEFTEENPSEKQKYDWYGEDDDEVNTENVERIDLLNIVMGQPQKYDSMQESEYKPTKSKDPKATYYKSEQTETEIKETFEIELRSSYRQGKSVDEVVNYITKGGKHGRGAGQVGGSVLQTYTIDKGVDEKGHYISYYDMWDLNPVPETGISAIDKGVGKVASYLTGKAGMKSPEIYGRIYYDPKTGEIIE